MHHRHHNHRIKIVPFNQADNDQTIPNTLYSVILESPVSTPLSNQQAFVNIQLLFLVVKTLNKLPCFQSKQTFWEVRECWFCFKYRCQRVYACRHYLFWQTPVSTPFIGCFQNEEDQRLSVVHN